MPLENGVSLPATIALGESLSGAVHLDGRVPCRIGMPAEWTAAVLTFQWSTDGTTYYKMTDDAGTEYSVTVAADDGPTLDLADFAGINYLKVRSGTAATPVEQEAARVLGIVTRCV